MKVDVKKFHLTSRPGCWGWINTYAGGIERKTEPTAVATTADEAAYLGLIEILKHAAPQSRISIVIDSVKVYNLYRGKRPYRQPDLTKSRNVARALIEEKKLYVELQYISPYRHLARRWFGDRY